MKVKTIIISLGALLVIFLLQNTQIVEVQFLFWKLSMSRSILLFGAIATGLIAGWLGKSFTTKK